jgi:CRISPR system Cascade subunit CasC
MSLQDLGIKLGYRTKFVSDRLVVAFEQAGAGEEKAKTCAEKLAKFLVDDTLMFISDNEIALFTEYAANVDFDPEKIKDKEVQKLSKKITIKGLNALDIALFGRMVAKAPTMNVEAASSFSHAISTHKVSNEIDFFTALDDDAKEPGSSHMGSIEFNSATYYRYISLDLDQLASMVPEEDLGDAVEAFTKALFIAVPNARQSTQSGASPWDFARVMVRRGQRLQVPFETAVRPKDGGHTKASIDALKEYLEKQEKMSGSLFGKVDSFDWGEDENYSIDDLIKDLKSHTA